MKSYAQGEHLTEKDFSHLPEAQRMQELEMYTGNKEQKPREEWLYSFSTGSIRKGVVTVPECIERCFLEPLSNASDNVHKSRRFGVPPGKVYVYVSPQRIIIENAGTPIPVQYKEEEGMYVPELSFGVPGTSSHYTEDVRHEAGVNGLGVKLTNGFSTYFKVEILDPINKKSYDQVWEGRGLDGRQDPIIEEYKGKESLVRVTFDLDYKHFKYDDNQAPMELFALFARHCADISFTTKVPVTFEYEMPDQDPQAIEFEVGHPRQYAYLYFGDLVETSLLHYEWPEGTRIIKEGDGRQLARNTSIMPLVEMCILDTPDNSETISFVNSMMTRDGGIHVEAALKSVSDHIVKFVNSNDTDGLNVTLKHIRPNLSLVMACMVKDPSFQGQTKNKLSGPKPYIRVTEKEIKPVMEWNMIQHLLAIIEAKKNQLLSQTDGKKRGNISTKNGRDANQAGKRKSQQCTLCIVEGLSASSYPKKLIDNMDNGRDLWGILPIRGKFLNVMKASCGKIANNKEIFELKKMLGLMEGVDYSIPENLKKLRYGRVIIMADADDDGKHIVALLLLYFHCRFPSLLQIGYVYNYLTPIIRVTKGKRGHKFFMMSEYEKWKKRNKNWHTWKTIYFKGLGRATDEQINEDYEDQRIIHCLYDDWAPQTITLAFSKERSDERKAWLAHFKEIVDVELVDQQPISEFINTELVKYGQLGLRRAIPNEMDGFKDSQRKVMWGAFRIWDNEKNGKIKVGNTKYKEMKVARIAARAAEFTNYHHGERSLEGTLVAMAQDFPGANNLPFFSRDGQFGTRDMGGKDASEGRYVETKPEKWIPLIFRREDLPILKLKKDEGEDVEPECFYPILPPVLINGANGIALAYSTYWPNHNPLDVVRWIKCKIGNKPLPVLTPWYRGFSGSIEVIDRRKGKRKRKEKKPDITRDTEENLDIPDLDGPNIPSLEEFNENTGEEEVEVNEPDFMKEIHAYVREFREERGRPLYSLVTRGKFHTAPNGKIVITELPIGRWTHPYLKWLEKLRDEDKLIRDVRDLSKSNLPGFELTGFKPIPSHKSLALRTQYGMSNMVLLDMEDKPQRYDSVADYLEVFYTKRLYYYGVRKEHILRQWAEKGETLRQKQTFLRAVIENELVIENRNKEDIFVDMDAMHLPHHLLTETKLVKLTEDEIVKLDEKIETLRTNIETLENTNPEKMWLQELGEFEREYRKHYKLPSRGDKLHVKVRTRRK